MEIVKKNLISIICGVVALAAIASAFFPLGGMWSTLQGSAQTRAGVFNEVQNLIKKERTLPVVTPDGEAKKLELAGQPLFPNPNVLEAAKAQLGVVKDNSKNFLDAAIKASERRPLVEGALPGNNPNPALETEFRNRYRMAMDTTAPNLARSMPGQILKAGCPPTADDVNRAAAEVRKEVETAMLQKGPNGQELNRPAVDLEINARAGNLFNDLKQQSAERAMVYVNPDGTSFTFDANFHPSAAANALTGPSAIFWAQINFWVQEELCRAIANVNVTAVGPDNRSPAKNLLEAPVKHIMAVRLNPGFAGYALSQQPQMVDPNNPPPPGQPFDRAAAMVKDPILSMTGRKSGGPIDVVLYDVDLVVEADRVPYVLERLGQNRYLSVVLVRSITPIDSTIQKAQGYLYGDKPCVKLTAQLEQVFMREWVLKYMPGSVKTLLQLADPLAPAPGATPPPPG